MKSLLIAASLAGTVIATSASADPQGHDRGHGRNQAAAGCAQAGTQQHMAGQHARMQAQMQGSHGQHGMRGNGPQAGQGNENCPMHGTREAS